MAFDVSKSSFLKWSELENSGLINSEIINSELNLNNLKSLSPRSVVTPDMARKLLIQSGVILKPKTISFQMLKGGVAKTSSALSIAIRASHYGYRVLLVDLDQQANLSYALGELKESSYVWLDIAEKKINITEAIVSVMPNLDLIPSNLNNSVLEKVLIRSHRNWMMSVKGPLEEIKNNYDWIIIDTAPSLTVVNSAVTCASQCVVLPVTPDPFAIMGLSKHLEELKEIESDFDLKGLDKKILFTRFDARESLSQKYLFECAEKYPDFMLDSYIRNTAEIKKSVQEKRDIFKTSTTAKLDYDLVTRELMSLQ